MKEMRTRHKGEWRGNLTMVYDDVYGTEHDTYTCPACGAEYELEYDGNDGCPYCGLAYEDSVRGMFEALDKYHIVD
jgi:rubrerythrin